MTQREAVAILRADADAIKVFDEHSGRFGCGSMRDAISSNALAANSKNA